MQRTPRQSAQPVGKKRPAAAAQARAAGRALKPQPRVMPKQHRGGR